MVLAASAEMRHRKARQGYEALAQGVHTVGRERSMQGGYDQVVEGG
jgi:hypothetical protein